jgi:uncharacterized RDD family membrane protein YckC
MNPDIQKASMLKRIIAWMFDSMLVVILAIMVATWLSAVLNYDARAEELENHYLRIEETYGVDFDITQEVYEALSPEQQAQFDKAYEDLSTDEETMTVYNLLISLTIVIISLSTLAAVILIELVVPLLFGNGQTLGKKIFGLALMRTDCVKITPLMLFIRTILGKFSVETMVPLLVGLMMLWGVIGIIAPIVLLGILALQVILMVRSEANCAIHDRLAYTVVVDYNSQLIFKTPEEAIAYRDSISKTETIFRD